MAAINDLIAQIQDPILRAKIEQEANKLTKQKKFGLVFEEHLPESTRLYGVPIRKGSMVTLKNDKSGQTFVVLRKTGDTAVCLPREGGDTVMHPLCDLVMVAEFGEPIYPYLEPLDSVCNAPDSDLWHTLIEADNYHALQLLEYLYAGKVDCIYIDPPYNTGAKDWKYNNDYVDGVDTYRHSKWLSFMQKRLKIAKKLLNPKDSVLIVTIDEKEYLHLGCLLEEMFPEANIQMISSRINATGIIRANEFTRVDEYIYFVMIGASVPQPIEKEVEKEPEVTTTLGVSWHGLRRRDAESMRGTAKGGIAQFYPIYVNDTTCKIEKIGNALASEVDRHSVEKIPGCTAVFPLKPDGTEMNWGLIGDVLKDRLSHGYVRVKRGRTQTTPYTIEYLTSGYVRDIECGKAVIKGYAADGSVIAEYPDGTIKAQPTTQWNKKSHYAKEYGTGLLRGILGDKRFSYPKSVYAVMDSLKCFCANKPHALIVDFFAGSGTTLHSVNLLNAEDGGKRRCIMVTNNEVSADEAKTLSTRGYQPGDAEWEKLGIAKYVTWPRTVCSIEGHDVNGKPLKGNYLVGDRPMADGFKANAAFFKLGFLDKTSIALGRQFKEMLPTLWMKSGAHGPCPNVDSGESPDMLILPENKFAVLTNEASFEEFAEKVNGLPQIETVYIVTDYEIGYRSMIKNIDAPNTYQLYRDYLDNFRINTGRN